MKSKEVIQNHRNELKGYFEPLKNNFDNSTENLVTISGHTLRIVDGKIESLSCHVGKYAGIKCYHNPHL